MKNIMYMISVLAVVNAEAGEPIPVSAHLTPEPVAQTAVPRARWAPEDGRTGFVLRPDSLAPSREAFIELVRGTHRGLWVLDASFDRDRPSRWTFAEIDAMRQTDPDRRVLAHLSVTMAEEGREYWDPTWIRGGRRTSTAPAWLTDQPGSEPGTWLVRFWDPAWQALVEEEVDGAVARGFDGVALGGLDAYMAWEGLGEGRLADRVNPETRRTYRQDLARWAVALSGYGRDAAWGAFTVFAHGGVELLASREYASHIDGVIAEGLFARDTERVAWAPQYLAPFAADGGVVVFVEDQLDGAARAWATEQAASCGCAALFLGGDKANLGVAR